MCVCLAMAGVGRDVVHRSKYSSLKLTSAWRVQHPALWARYEAGKAQVRTPRCQRVPHVAPRSRTRLVSEPFGGATAGR